jgi:hypothetical protein
VVLVAHLVVALTHGGPVAVPDVPTYLSVAQWVAGGLEPPPFGYHPGYGLLLAPVALLGASPDALHTAALVLNGLLAAVAVALAAGLARSLAPTGPWWAPLAAGVVAALHPSLTTASRIAWAETLLTVLVLATAWLVVQATRTGSSTAYAAAGFMATIGVAAHPRMAALAVAASIGVAIVRPGWRSAGWYLAGAIAAAAVTALVLEVAYTGDSMGGRLLETAESSTEGAGVLTTVAGQLTAIAASTAALALIGLVDAVRRGAHAVAQRFAIAGLDRDRLAASAVIGGGAAITIVVAGASLAGSDRADTLAYGRYADPYTVALAVFALSTLAVARRRVLAAAAVVLVAASTMVWLEAGAVARPATRLMVAGTDVWWRLSGGRLLPALLATTLVVAAGIGLWSLRDRVPRAAPVALALAFGVMAASTVTSHLHLAGVGRVSAGQATAASVVRDLGDAAPGCLGHDRTGVASYVMWLYRWQLPATEHRRVDLSAGEEPCSPLVIAHVTDSVLAGCPDAILVADEPRGDWGLWEVPPGTC